MRLLTDGHMIREASSRTRFFDLVTVERGPLVSASRDDTVADLKHRLAQIYERYSWELGFWVWSWRENGSLRPNDRLDAITGCEDDQYISNCLFAVATPATNNEIWLYVHLQVVTVLLAFQPRALNSWK